MKELDDEGVLAFQAAAPFGELPEGLVRQGGRITFWFSFYVEAGGLRMAWRFRQGSDRPPEQIGTGPTS